jgi:hypothetical protein
MNPIARANEALLNPLLYPGFTQESVRRLPALAEVSIYICSGVMFTFVWKKFSGSYFAFSARNRR